MEKWKDIDGHPNHQVSDRGRVMNKKTGRIMKQFKAHNGYMQTQIDKKSERIHRMVASAFLGGNHPDMDVNHIDSNKENNCASNLEWCTRSQNICHSFANGTRTSNLNNEFRRKGNRVMADRTGRHVAVLETGVVYPSIKDCAREMQTYPGKIRECCCDMSKTYCGYHFKFV